MTDHNRTYTVGDRVIATGSVEHFTDRYQREPGVIATVLSDGDDQADRYDYRAHLDCDGDDYGNDGWLFSVNELAPEPTKLAFKPGDEVLVTHTADNLDREPGHIRRVDYTDDTLPYLVRVAGGSLWVRATEVTAAPASTHPYYRNPRGTVVHLAACKRKGKAVPWIYVDDYFPPEVAQEVGAKLFTDIALCQFCWPRDLLELAAETRTAEKQRRGV